MMLDGTDADGEWSDEEVVRSGSNTGVSETEAEDNHPSVTIKRPQSSLGLVTSRPTYNFMASDSISHKEDPVTSILDRIDAEIEMIGQTPSLPSPPTKNGKHRNGSLSKSKSSYRNGNSQALPTSDNPEDTDTGLGSTSIRGDEGSNPDKINGVAEIYSEACMTDGQTDGQTDDDGFRQVSDAPSDLDSVAAQQIDTKFKEIMRKKKDDPEEVKAGATRHRPRRRMPHQGQSRVHFLTPPPQFRDYTSSLPPDLPIHPGKPTASLTLTPRLRPNRTRPSAVMLSTGYGTDTESVRTEDFETKFNNLLVTSDNERQSEIIPPAPKQGILSKSSKKRESENVSKTNSSERHLPDSAPKASNSKPEDDDILKRLMNIANSPTPSSTNQAVQGSSTSRPRSLSPSRLSLRKHHTSGDLHGLWQSSGSNSSLKTNWDDPFWTGNKSNNSGSKYNNSRRSPSGLSSNSTFDEVESLNFSSRSSNDSNHLSHDRSSFGSRKGAAVGGRFFRRESGFFAGGSGERAIGGDRGIRGFDSYGDRRYLSRQSSTTSTSTSPSSGNFGSSDTSQASSKDMVLAKRLLDILESFGNQSNLGPADTVYLHRLRKQIAEWDFSNSNGGGEMSSSAMSRPNKEPFPTWSESGSMASSSGMASSNGKNKDESIDGSKHQKLAEQLGKSLISQKKRRKDLIIPDDEDTAVFYNDYTRKKESEGRRLKDQSGSGLTKSLRRGESKENISQASRTGCLPQGTMMYSERSTPMGKNILLPSRSFNKSGSLDSNTSPPDGYNPMVRPFSTSHAERVLMGLGFGGKEGFLPERFLRDWYSKLSMAEEKEYLPTWESDGKTKEKDKQSNKDSSSIPFSQKESGKKENEKSHGQLRNFRQDSFSSSQLDEASTLPTRINSQDGKARQINEYLSALSTNANSDAGSREMRIKNFANSRQKSLPLYLETLSEEDEKGARVPGVDPFDKEAKLQMFITDVMSNSGKSTGSNSEHSVPSSNMSEYDTQSSSSDGQNLSMLINSDILKSRAEKYHEHQTLSLKTIKESPNLAKELENTSMKNAQIPIQRASPKSPKGGRQNKTPMMPTTKTTTTTPTTTLNGNKSQASEREVRFSTDSMEVADIMKDDQEKSSHLSSDSKIDKADIKPTRNPMLKSVEPAMVSIVLEDVDEGKSDSYNRTELTRTESGRLSVPTSSSSLSLSPIPQSPVTVIEVGLDNTNDSLDTEDGLNSSREIDNYSPQNEGGSGSGRPTSVSCANCGNAVVIKRKRNSSNNERRHNSEDRIEDNHLSPNRQSRLCRDRAAQKVHLDVSKESPTARWNNSSDESSYEGMKRRRENKLTRNRSPNSFNRRRSPNSVHLSPCHLPTYNRQEMNTESCSKRCHHSASSQCSSLSPSPVSSVSENVKRRRWMEQAHAENSVFHDYHCHDKCSYPLHKDKTHCAFHHFEYQHPYQPCQHHPECCPYHYHHHHLPQQSPKYAQPLQQPDYQTNPTSISAHSSPGSAFRSPRKEKETRSDISDEAFEKSETDQDEFPSRVSITLNPRFIDSSTNDTLRHSCILNGGNTITNMMESFGDHPSPLIFSEESCSHSVISKTSKGQVQQISRAVQANLQQCSTVREKHFVLTSDKQEQCSIGDISERNRHKIAFNKYVQTVVPSCEVSCQTIDGASVADNYTYQHRHVCTSKSVNTVISLIGDEHGIDTNDALTSDISKPLDISKSYELQLVDDTLDLIEMELVAIEDKAKNRQYTNNNHSTSSRRMITSPSAFLNPNQIDACVSTNSLRKESVLDPFVSFTNKQSSPLEFTYQSATNNPFVNIGTTAEGKSAVQCSKAEKDAVLPMFDVEKEMSAYLRPCQGMYDGMSTPDSFRSSPCDNSRSPSVDRARHNALTFSNMKTTEARNTTPADETSSLETTHNDSLPKAKDSNTRVGADSSTREKSSPLLKRHTTPLICVNDFQKDFLQIPSSPNARISKSWYPSDDMSSPKSWKSASPFDSMTLQETPHCSVTPRSYSLNDIPTRCQLDTNMQSKDKEPKIIPPFITLDSEVELDMPKSESIEINSENSEIPYSSSRDSLTEVSILSSVERQSQSLQVNTSLDSVHNEEMSVDGLNLPEGVEFSLECPHSNWEGMYGHTKFRWSRKERLLRTQTDGTDRFISIYGMDALSDKSLAGSEKAQDIDEMEVITSQIGLQRRDSDSSYSDVDNDSVYELSEGSGSVRDEVEKESNNFLIVSDDHYDLLQVSECGEQTPNRTRMSPCFDDVDTMIHNRNDEVLSPKLVLDTENARNTYFEIGNETSNDIMIKDIEKSHKNTSIHDTHSNKQNTDITLDKEDMQDAITVDPLFIEAHSVSNCRELNLDQLSSPDYDVVPSVMNRQPELPRSLEDNTSTYAGQPVTCKDGAKGLYTMKSDPVDKAYAWWPTLSSSEKTIQSNPNDYGVNKKANLLKTFQKAEFDSLLNKTISEDSTAYSSSSVSENVDKNPFIKSETSPNIESVTNAHILSVETEDDSENKVSEMDSFMEECNIMDELEIIALFKNMEHLNECDTIDYAPKICSPYPLSEIPEEDTQSEESLNLSGRFANESARTIFAQETQESVIENNYLYNENVKKHDFQDSSIVGLDEDFISDSGHEDGFRPESKCSDGDSNRNSQNREGDFVSNNYRGQSPSPKAHKATTFETIINKEEHLYSSGLVYHCNSKSETSQKTILNFDTSKQMCQNTIDTADAKDEGHLSTMTLTVGDYRNEKSGFTENEKTATVPDESIVNKKSKTRSPIRHPVRTMHSQSFSDDSTSVIISTRPSSMRLQEESSHEKNKAETHSPAGKRLRSRESLLRLHQQKKYTGSDSDSESTHQTTEDNGPRKMNSDSDEPNDNFSVDENEDDKIFKNFLTYDGTPRNSENDIFTLDSVPNKHTDSIKNRPVAHLSITKGVIFAENETQEPKKIKENPRVIVQQPSDDVPFWDTLSWRNASSSSPPTISGDSDHHLHPSDADERGDVNEYQISPNRSFQKTTKTYLWNRRTNRPNSLSPNVALLNDAFKEPVSLFRREHKSPNDDSHPELDYLNILPKFSGEKEHSPKENRLSLPVQRLGVDKNSNQAMSTFFGATVSDGSNNVELGKIVMEEKLPNIVKNSLQDTGNNLTNSRSLDFVQDNSLERDSCKEDVQTTITEQKIKDKEKRTEIECMPEVRIPQADHQISNEEIDQFVNSRLCDGIINQLISTESSMPFDSVDSSDSKFVTAISRDSGFESRGSPIEHSTTKGYSTEHPSPKGSPVEHPSTKGSSIEHSNTKGSQRRNVLSLSGVQFSDEFV